MKEYTAILDDYGLDVLKLTEPDTKTFINMRIRYNSQRNPSKWEGKLSLEEVAKLKTLSSMQAREFLEGRQPHIVVLDF